MEKKRSAGVIVFGIIGIIIGLVILYWFVHMLRISILYTFHRPNILSRLLTLFFFSTTGISFVVCGISILKLKNWARILIMPLMVIYSILGSYITYAWIILQYPDDPILFKFVLPVGSYLVFFLAPLIISIYFFTRSKVKEQFK